MDKTTRQHLQCYYCYNCNICGYKTDEDVNDKDIVAKIEEYYFIKNFKLTNDTVIQLSSDNDELLNLNYDNDGPFKYMQFKLLGNDKTKYNTKLIDGIAHYINILPFRLFNIWGFEILV